MLFFVLFSMVVAATLAAGPLRAQLERIVSSVRRHSLKRKERDDGLFTGWIDADFEEEKTKTTFAECSVVEWAANKAVVCHADGSTSTVYQQAPIAMHVILVVEAADGGIYVSKNKARDWSALPTCAVAADETPFRAAWNEVQYVVLSDDDDAKDALQGPPRFIGNLDHMVTEWPCGQIWHVVLKAGVAVGAADLELVAKGDLRTAFDVDVASLLVNKAWERVPELFELCADEVALERVESAICCPDAPTTEIVVSGPLRVAVAQALGMACHDLAVPCKVTLNESDGLFGASASVVRVGRDLETVDKTVKLALGPVATGVHPSVLTWTWAQWLSND